MVINISERKSENDFTYAMISNRILCSNSLKEQLKNIIQNKAFIIRHPPEEPFKLASGKTSWFYFDCKMVTQDSQGIAILAEIIFDKIKDYDIDGIGGIATGSIPICTAVSQLSFMRGNQIPAFWVRDRLKRHGTKKRIEGVFHPKSRVVILDDVTTTGKSIGKAITAVLDEGCKIVEIISMVDREEGAREKFEKKGLKFTSLFKMSEFNLPV